MPIASLETSSRSISARLGLVGCVRMAFKRDAPEGPLEVLDVDASTDLTKSETELGYTVRPFEDSIRDSYAWFEQEGML